VTVCDRSYLGDDNDNLYITLRVGRRGHAYYRLNTKHGPCVRVWDTSNRYKYDLPEHNIAFVICARHWSTGEVAFDSCDGAVWNMG
jgi:hypothetical protein